MLKSKDRAREDYHKNIERRWTFSGLQNVIGDCSAPHSDFLQIHGFLRKKISTAYENKWLKICHRISFHIEFLRPFFFKILATTLVLDRNLTFCFVLLAVMCNFFFFGILGSCRTRKARLWDCFEIRVGEPDSKLHCHLRLCVYVCAPRASCDGEGCLCAYSCLQNPVSGKISTCCAISKAHSVNRLVKLHCYSILNAKYHDIVPWWYPSCVLHAFKEK